MSVTSSKDPPPPPPRELPPGVGEGVGGVVVGAGGVVPEVMGGAQAVLPPDAGASVDTPLGMTITCAESVRPRSSVTVTSRMTSPEVGAWTVALAVVDPEMAGGLLTGDTTDQAYPDTVRPQAAVLAEASKLAG